MKKQVFFRLGLGMASVFAAGLLLAGLASAAEFSANTVVKAPGQPAGKSMSGKLYVKGTKIRQELSSGNMKEITIVRPDKGSVWMLMPEKKSYYEARPGKEALAVPKWQQIVKNMPGMKKVGVEKINGYQCDKYRAVSQKEGQEVTITLWVSKKLGQDVKTEIKSAKGTMTVSLQNIREQTQPSSLFELPRGYKKAEMPSMGGGPGMPPPGR